MEKQEILEIEIGNSEQTIKELKEQIKNLRKEFDNCTIGSEEFKNKLNELNAAQDKLKQATKGNTDSNEALEGSYDALTAQMAKLRKEWKAVADEAQRNEIGQQISDINNQLKEMDASIGNYQRNVGNYASAFDDVTLKIEGGVAKFERFNNISRSVIGSFDLVEGGLKAIGVESEEVNGLMDQMQGLMVITNGLTSIKEGVQAFNSMRVATQTATVAQHGLNAAMKANPIGAVIAVIMAAVAALTALVGWMTKAADSADSLKEKNDELNSSIEKQNEELEYNIRLMKAKGESEISQLKADYEGKLEIAKKAYAEYKAMEKEAMESKRWGGLAGSISAAEQEQLDAAYQKFVELENEYKKAVDNYNLAVIESNRKRREQEVADAEASKKLAREVADAKIEEEKRVKAEISKLYNDQKDELEEYWLNEYQLRGKRLEEWLKKEKELNQKAKDEGVINEEKYQERLNAINLVYNDKKKQLYEDALKATEEYFGESATIIAETAEKTSDKLAESVDKVTWSTMQMAEKVNAAAGLIGTAFGQTAQLLNTLSQQQDKTTKEGFETAKKMSIGAAVMSMLQGIISSWTSAMSLPAPISFITGGLMSAFTATLGGIQIDQIKKQTFNNAGKGSSTSSVPQPTINTSSLLGNPISYTSEIIDSNIEDTIPQRVYVVESDITTIQNKVRTVEDESTF